MTMDKNDPCKNCVHYYSQYIDIDGSGRHDYLDEDCDANCECNEENGFKGWKERKE